MIFAMDITTPANTPATAPVYTTIPATRGLVYRVEFDFPPGALGLHYVAVSEGLHQLWPTQPHTWFHPDGLVIGFDETYPKLSPPYEFTAISYNLDDTYDHLVQVRIGILGNEMLWSRFIPGWAPGLQPGNEGLLDDAFENERQRFLQDAGDFIGSLFPGS